jgi:hypothetical protein
MDTRTQILVIAVAVALVIVAAVLITRERNRRLLKEKFGPEYDRAVLQHGDARRAEAVLIDREKRVRKFSLQPLPPAARERYAEEWVLIQRRFVDDPAGAVTQADALVNTVLAARGYPVGNFEQRAADISVNYPGLVQNYRSARAVMLRQAENEASTEDLRVAMVNFRSLFDELLDSPTTQRLAS